MEQRIQFCTTPEGIRIAHAVHGEGYPLISISGWTSHIELMWESNEAYREGVLGAVARGYQRIIYDKRGTGLSTRPVEDLSTEAQVGDLEALVAQLKLKKFALYGYSEGGPIAIAYAAAHPRQVSHLVLQGTYPLGSALSKPEAQRAMLALVRAEWGVGSMTLANLFMNGASQEEIDGFQRFQRKAASAEEAASMLEADYARDVTGLLGDITAPTLVLHGTKDRAIPIAAGRDIAAGIKGARFVTYDGAHVPTGAARDEVSEKMFAFLDEHREQKKSRAKPKPVQEPHSGLVTIMFTDIEGSTSMTQRLGDAGAQDLLRTHNALLRDALKEYGGREIKHTGDGIMASFPLASSALDCAIAVQRAFAAHNDEHAEAAVRVRIGLNAGEPVAEDDPGGRGDLFGTSVQLAARVCAKAEPGQVLASNVVRELAAGKGHLFADQGDVVLRGFEDPVRLYEVRTA
jgi:class 3 adenylate cyclase